MVLGLEVCYLFYQILSPCFILLFLLRITRLRPLNLLALDLIDLVEQAEQRGVDAVVPKVPVEENTALLQCFTNPSM